jgi:hypothetical protein
VQLDPAEGIKMLDNDIDSRPEDQQPTTANHWRDHVKVHEVADQFPMVSDVELKKLGDDIRKKGMDQPIAFYIDKERPDARKDARLAIDLGAEIAAKRDRRELPLIDGRNRLEAMQRAGLLVADRLSKEIRRAKIVYASEYTPEEYVATVNVHRRHLTPEWLAERRERIAALLKEHPEKTDRQIAKETGASPTTVGTARANVQSGHKPRQEVSGRTARGRQPGKQSAPPPVTAPPAPEPVKPVTAGVAPDAPPAPDARAAVRIDLTTSDDELAEQLAELIGEPRLLEMAPRFFEQPLDQRGEKLGKNPISKLIEAFSKFTEVEDIPTAERRALAKSCLHVLDLTPGGEEFWAMRRRFGTWDRWTSEGRGKDKCYRVESSEYWRETIGLDGNLYFHAPDVPVRVWAVSITRTGFVWADAEVLRITEQNVTVRYAGEVARLDREKLWRWWAFYRAVRFVSSRTGRVAQAHDEVWQEHYGHAAAGVPPSMQMPLAEAMALLGVSANYIEEELLAAFRREAKKAHPDAGGTAEQFIKLREARDRLLASIGTSAPKPQMPTYAPKGAQIVYRSARFGSRRRLAGSRLRLGRVS